jgi:hypothetical protein
MACGARASPNDSASFATALAFSNKVSLDGDARAIGCA